MLLSVHENGKCHYAIVQLKYLKVNTDVCFRLSAISHLFIYQRRSFWIGFASLQRTTSSFRNLCNCTAI